MVHDLYQEIILDHSKHPRNCHAMAEANRQAEGYNPLCGDKLKLFLKMDGDKVVDASFEGSGCAISTASASLMTETLKGKTRQEAMEMLEKFHELLTTDTPVRQDLGKLVVFCGVRDYPARVKCATLAWHTLKSALSGSAEVASTE
ncbi:MAG TPA: SUF system NifU family Fe-S cluster assembly protein [Bryobacteraceae bacterium]|nr:SUF system NifU family Fe-S cluster assembly protein [Bryobacteraceae bacterium]